MGMVCRKSGISDVSKICRLLALAERDSKNATDFFFFCRSVAKRGACSQAFLTETVETGDKIRDDFHCMQMSLVMSMRFIFGENDWNDACKLKAFPLFGNDEIFPKSRPLIFV